jgi:hypothetical protein
VDATGKLTGCSESAPGATVEYLAGAYGCKSLATKVLNVCGQVDLVDSSKIYCQTTAYTNAQVNCPASSCTPKTSTPATTPPVAPSCAAFSTYDTDWKLLYSTDLSSLKAGETVNFCVTGSAVSGSFDMARFIINGVQQADTTARRPNSTDFCQSYTIPADVTSFSISAQIHHSTGVWY